MKLPVSCFKCDKELQPAMGDDSTNQPYAGTAFKSHGHYGSTIFDPMNNSFLELNICDKCLDENRHKILFNKGDMTQTIRNPYEQWLDQDE